MSNNGMGENGMSEKRKRESIDFARQSMRQNSLLAGAPVVGMALLVSVAVGVQARPVPQQGKTKPSTSKPSVKPSVSTDAGKAIFKQTCAACHGAEGQGTKQYARPLTGTRTLPELARYISQTMPPGPKKCPAPDAQKVAAYIYDAFYSPIAQARNSPARVALSRLTVRQYRGAVSDLIASFRPQGRNPKENATQGLHASYYKAKRFDNNERIVERTDGEVNFDFGTAGPVADKFEPHQFSIRWDGSVCAPDTGEYEFIVRTDHAARLWLNSAKKPFIDAWVKSGKDTEFRGSIYLLGGRTYPIRLEFTKSTQGVDDTAKKAGKPAPPAFVALAWKRPKQADEVIPARALTPAQSQEVFVSTTPFPPDDRSTGYERGNSVNKAWDEATTTAALETAAYITNNLRDITGIRDEAPDRKEKLQKFCEVFVNRAFRRPLTDDVTKTYIEKQFQATSDPAQAVKRVVVLTLLSPRFLYREAGSQKPDPYDVASRLSFALWDSIPDAELLRVASVGELETRDQVVKQAERMVNDPRAQFKLRGFFLQWLHIDLAPDLAKDKKKYPDFDAHVAADLRTSLDLTLDSVLNSDRADYRDLMLSDKVFLNGRLAKIYGVKLPADAPFQPVALDAGQRAGLLTHPYLLSTFAYLDTSSPIHRGVLLYRNVMGRVLQPPPAAVAPLPADLHPNMTTRQRVALQTKPEFCNGCHSKINTVGFTLEKFDALGRIRAEENGQPIDSSGSYEDRNGKLIRFAGPADLARFVANSNESHDAFVEKLFQNLIAQPVRAYGMDELPNLQHAFVSNEYNIRKLMVDIATDAARADLSNLNTPRKAPAPKPGGGKEVASGR